MSAENLTAKAAAMGFTPREMELAFLAWRAIDSGINELKFDYDKLAELGNFKNAASARANFHSVKRKLLQGNLGGEASASPATTAGAGTGDNKKGPRGKKRAKENPPLPTAQAGKLVVDEELDGGGGGGGASDDDHGETPTKKPRKAPSKNTKKTNKPLPASVVDASEEESEQYM